jgi:hypothetical protein
MDTHAREDSSLDMSPRYAPKIIICKTAWVPVLRYVAHPKGAKPEGCPLIVNADDMALECVTERGSRFFICKRAWVNSELRMVVEGTNRRDEVRMAWPICTV